LQHHPSLLMTLRIYLRFLSTVTSMTAGGAPQCAGDEVCSQILARPSAGPTEWERLLEPLPFFEGFKHFLQVCLPHQTDRCTRWQTATCTNSCCRRIAGLLWLPGVLLNILRSPTCDETSLVPDRGDGEQQGGL
jgi:hypothetical protein